MSSRFQSGILALATVVLLVLAGCSGSKDKPAGTPDPTQPTVTDHTGSIVGVITNDELLGIPGAQLLLQGSHIQGVADAEGRFVLNDVVPATYTLVVAAIGYDSRAERVVVEAGEITEKNLMLTRLVASAPHIETIPFSGRFECSLAAVDTAWLDCAEGPGLEDAFPDSNSRFSFNKTEGATYLVAELRWQQASAGTGRNLDFNLVAGPDHDSCQWYANTFGPSPLKIVYKIGEEYVNPASPAAVGTCEDTVLDDEDSEYGFDIYSSPIYTSDMGADERAALIGLTFQQPYEGIVSVFYGLEPGADFSGFPDA